MNWGVKSRVESKNEVSKEMSRKVRTGVEKEGGVGRVRA